MDLSTGEGGIVKGVRVGRKDSNGKVDSTERK
jgi:hypothetical protein